MHRSIILSSFFMLLLGAGCGSGSGQNSEKEESSRGDNAQDYKKEAGYAPAAEEGSLYAMNDATTTTESSRVIDHVEVTNRKLIKEGWFTFRTYDMSGTEDRIRSITKKYDGYISREDQYDRRDGLHKSIEVRVPNKHFDTFVERLGQGVEHFEQKEISVQDVTAEYVDVEARIRSKKEMETRYLALLDKAHTVHEILEIEHHLGQIRVEIESAEARLKSLKDRTSYSTLNIEFYTPVEEYEYAEDEPAFWDRMSDSLRRGWQAILAGVVSITAAWPAILMSLALGLFIWMKWVRKRRKSILA